MTDTCECGHPAGDHRMEADETRPCNICACKDFYLDLDLEES